MSDQLLIPKENLPPIKHSIPTAYGLILLLVILSAVGVMYFFLSKNQKMEPTPLILVTRIGRTKVECKAGVICSGPVFQGEDPEGDDLTYKFYDQATGELVHEVKAASGEAVAPEFTFSSSGEKQLYMVVEDGSGHTSKNYPLIIPVK